MKKTMLIILTLLLALALLAGCGAPAAPAAEPTEQFAGLPNPVKASSREEIAERFGLDMAAPEGAEEISYSIIDGETPLAQLGYCRDGLSWCYRAARSAETADISGMYYEWTRRAEGAGGAQLRWNDGEAGVIERFDAAEGRMLSLSLGHGADESVLSAEAALLFPASEAQRAELNALLDALRGRYFPGTAGSSLSAAACAAELADFFAESGIAPDEVDACVRDFLAALPDEDRELFELQLDGAVSAFSSLTGENGAGLLGDCGYAARHFPWDDAGVRDCFVALLGSD